MIDRRLIVNTESEFGKATAKHNKAKALMALEKCSTFVLFTITPIGKMKEVEAHAVTPKPDLPELVKVMMKFLLMVEEALIGKGPNDDKL